MPLPKTYWNDLSEQAQIAFFDFWMNREKEGLCSNCPGWQNVYGAEILTIGLEQPECCECLCQVLFRLPHTCSSFTEFSCPCNYYDSDDAIAALEKAIMEWIGE